MRNLCVAAVLGWFLVSICAAQNCSPASTSLMMTFGALPSGAIGTPYTEPLSASGGTPPYTWSAATLNSFDTGLPPGLSVSQSGIITGTPASTAVTRNVSLTVTDSANVSTLVNPSGHNSCTQLFALVINPSLYINTAVLPAAAVGTPYNQTLAISGANGAVTWSATGLPAGLTLNPATGAITGSPTATGTSLVAVSVTDNSIPKQTATRTISFVVGPAGSLPVITTIAGNGTKGFSGDGGPALSAALSAPEGMALDAAGNLYFADVLNNRVRKVAPNGTISTVAGNGSAGSSGDGGPATSAAMVAFDVAVDAAGNLYITDIARIRKVAPNGTISTVAGTGTEGFSGDGGPATSAQLLAPEGVTVDAAGNIYIADTDNNRIRKVTPAGIITTVAGNGVPGFSGDGGAATSAALNKPTRVVVDAAGNLYIADEQNNRVRKVTANGNISTLAGTGVGGYSGDGGPAVSAMIYNPYDVQVDSAGNVFIADSHNNVIREVTPDGTINTVVGTGIAGFSGDGGPASSAQLAAPAGLLLAGGAVMYVADSGNERIRRVGPATTGLTAAPSTLSFGAYVIGGTVPASQAVSLSSTNPTSGLAFTSALGSDCAWLNLAPASGATPVTVTASVIAANVIAGSHSCVITFNAAGVSPSPTVTATLTASTAVLPILSAAPATLSFGNYTTGGTVPAAQTIALTSTNPPAGLAFTSSPGSDCAWLNLAPTSGATPVTVTASVIAANATVGNHTCVITFNAPGVSPGPTVTATLTAAAPIPTLSPAPATLAFGTFTPGGTVPAAQTISLSSTNPSAGLGFTSTPGSDCAWLNLSPASGATPVTVTASVIAANATAGSHSCVVTFNATGVSPSPSVTATLTVAAPPTLSAAPATLPFGNYTIGGTVPAAQTIAITSTNPASGLAFATAVGSDCGWLNLPLSPGRTPVTLTASVIAANVTAGSHTCVITFIASGVSPNPTVTATLTAIAPTALSAAPAALSFGTYTMGGSVPTSQTISVSSANPASGLAFTSALGSDCAWLALSPASGSTSATVTASVNASSATLGNHSCVITFNAAGVTPSPTVTATLSVVQPQAPSIQISPSVTQVTTIATGATVTLNLASPAPATLTATLSLSFAPNAAGLPSGPYADPGLQFAQGGTTTTLTVNQGSSSPTTAATIQTGSVAGTITVTLTTLTEVVNGQTVGFLLSSPSPSTTIVVPRLAPAITTVKIINVTATGFTVDIVASSTPRDLTSASLTFTAASGAQLTGTSFTGISLSSPAATWFSSTPGQTAGGSFDLQIPFTYTGNTSAIGSASVTLTNSVNASAPVSGTQ